ncbi:MAG: ribosomal maturation YjgA family protein [Mucilaginibacter sp.]
MLKSRLTWFIFIVITIVAGLLSRHFAGIPLFIGDMLWATMVYFIVRFLFVAKTVNWVVVASLVFCFCIEFSQLYKAPWINGLRHTLFGRLVLGETFLWGDLLSYTVGVGIAVLVELVVKKHSRAE